MRIHKWTRERVIRDLLSYDARGLSLIVDESGNCRPVYKAATRIFGSWQNAIKAAGIKRAKRTASTRWTPARVLAAIRRLSQRRNPLKRRQVEQRFRNIYPAAERFFGSWANAILASGVDPRSVQRLAPWTRERVIEALLKHALQHDPLTQDAIRPPSVLKASRRIFGSWANALEAAGLRPAARAARVKSRSPAAGSRPTEKAERVPKRQPWTTERVISAIQARVAQNKPLSATAVRGDESGLYLAGLRRFARWKNALAAAGICPSSHPADPSRRKT